MSTETVNETLSEERRELALEASWEVASIADALVEVSQTLSVDDLFIRGLSIRVQQLARVIMSALSDDVAAPADLRVRLTGQQVRSEEVSRG